MDIVLGNPLHLTSCFEQGVGLYDLHSTLPTSDILGVCEKPAPISPAEVRWELALQGSGEKKSFPVATVTTRLSDIQHITGVT